MTTLLGLGACTHPSVVLTPTVGQSLGLAGIASGSGMGSASDFLPHFFLLVIDLFGIGHTSAKVYWLTV